MAADWLGTLEDAIVVSSGGMFVWGVHVLNRVWGLSIAGPGFGEDKVWNGNRLGEQTLIPRMQIVPFGRQSKDRISFAIAPRSIYLRSPGVKRHFLREW